MLLGQEFSGYAAQVELCAGRIRTALEGIYELPLGGTAIGTGLNAIPGFAPAVIADIAARTGLPFREAANHFEAQASKDAVSFLSGALKTYAVALTKIANDIRWLGSGPRCGLGELKLPETQPGSSIMPGKVNPVIPEAVAMICAQVIGSDATILVAGQASAFQLNTMLPVIAWNLLTSIHLLSGAMDSLGTKAIAGFVVNETRVAELAGNNPILATALAPVIGYDQSAEIAKEVVRSGRSVIEVALEKTSLSETELRKILDPAKMTG